jgi:hypothetical protein
MNVSWKRIAVAAACLAPLTLALGCGDHGGNSITGGSIGPPPGLSSCTASPFLTVSPIPPAALATIAPLGALNPPSHTFPTDHIYFYKQVGAQLASPGTGVVTNVVVQHRTGGGLAPFDDYNIRMFPCADLMLQFGHVSSLAAVILAQVGALDGNCQPAYVTGGFTYQQCYADVNIAVSAGQIIAFVSLTLDVWARDRRVTMTYANDARLVDPVGPFGDKHVVCALDYFVASVGDQLRSKIPRTAPPVCGDIAQDVPNTAAGRWFHTGSPNLPEDAHLALAHDNLTPSLEVFSVGTSIPSLPAGAYSFTPASSGRVNLDFALVTTIGEIECYTVTANRRVLIQLASVSRLRIQGFGTGACGDPATWILDASAVEFDR